MIPQLPQKGASNFRTLPGGIDDTDGRSREQALPAWTLRGGWGGARLRVFNDTQKSMIDDR